MTQHVPVFPAPRAVDLSGDRADVRIVGEAVDVPLPPHGYRLTLTADGVTIDHRDEAGLRYGRDTVAQLAARSETSPCGVIEDWPSFTERAYMLDVSRDRVPTMDTLEWLIGVLGRLRFTELQLYTEHTFAWVDHAEVWRHASPLTPDELARLAERCRVAGMQLVPCLNGFGHMERFLRHDRYRDRAECPDGAPAMFGDGTVPPSTLAPTPENARFALDLFREVLRALPSRRVHIGGDEPFELGEGRSAAEVGARGRTAVYAEHLSRLIEPLVGDGHDVLFWGDMFVRSPEQVAALPRGSTAVAWWYQAPVPDPPPISRVLGPELADRLGLPEDALAGFVAHTRAFADTGFPFWVAPGTSTWNSLVGRWPNARANIDDAVAVGLERGADGLLVTDWGDNGHHQPLACSLAPLVHAAGTAWSAETHDADVVAGVIDDLVGAAGLGEALIELGSIEESLGVRQFNAGAIHNALLGTFSRPRRHGFDEDRAAAAVDVLARADGLSPSGAGSRSDIVAEEIGAAASLARIGLHRLGAELDVRIPGAPDDLATAIERQRRSWLRTSRPGGLDDSLARLSER